MKFLSAPKNEQFIECIEHYGKYLEHYGSKKYEIYETETHFLYVEIDPEVDELIETETSIITNLVVHEAKETGFVVNNEENPMDIFFAETDVYSSDLLLLIVYTNSINK